MRFKKIKFDNYRCFLNGEIEFCEKDGKNINLILGNNGAGKTEVLFAFWWLLYGFNFKQLKNKEATPYALNFSLYKSIQDGERNSASCSVEAEIEDGDTTYIVNRTANMKRNLQLLQSRKASPSGITRIITNYPSLCAMKLK